MEYCARFSYEVHETHAFRVSSPSTGEDQDGGAVKNQDHSFLYLSPSRGRSFTRELNIGALKWQATEKKTTGTKKSMSSSSVTELLAECPRLRLTTRVRKSC